MAEAEGARWLWLFSSNRRALYAQDVSNVAALPTGAPYQFRYRGEWVGAEAQAAWEQGRLDDHAALIVFSFQHPEHLHPPAFMPVRAARVTDARVVGSFYVVEFELGEHSTLPPHSRRSDDGLPTMGERVQTFSRAVEKLLGEGHPGGKPNKSAVLGPPPRELVDGTAEAWERIVEQLAGSGAFPNHLFFRVTDLTKVGGATPPMTEGRYELVAGDTYELHLAHYQPQPFPARRHLNVVVDDKALAVHGNKSVEITSGYDSMRVRFQAVYRDEPLETTVTIEPATGEEGARVVLPVRISPPRREKAFRIGLGTLAVLAAAVPGAMKDFEGWGLGGVIAVIAVGGFAAAWLTNRSRIRLPR